MNKLPTAELPRNETAINAGRIHGSTRTTHGSAAIPRVIHPLPAHHQAAVSPFT
jgi:hypothetical protein